MSVFKNLKKLAIPAIGIMAFSAGYYISRKCKPNRPDHQPSNSTKAGPLSNTALILSNSIQMPMDVRNRNTCIVIGDSGSGKTHHWTAANLAFSDLPYFITDYHGIMHQEYKDYLERKGYIVKCIHFCHPDLSDGYNPFCHIHTIQDMEYFVRLTMDNTTGTVEPVLHMSEAYLLMAITEFCVNKQALPDEVIQYLDALIECHAAGDDETDTLFEGWNYAMFYMSAGEQYWDVIESVSQRLHELIPDSFYSITANDTPFHGRERLAVFLALNDQNSPLASIITAQAMHEMEGRFLLDDFYHLGRIYDLPSLVTHCHAGSISLLVHTIGELKEKCDEWETLLENISAIVCLQCHDALTGVYLREHYPSCIQREIAPGKCLIIVKDACVTIDAICHPSDHVPNP